MAILWVYSFTAVFNSRFGSSLAGRQRKQSEPRSTSGARTSTQSQNFNRSEIWHIFAKDSGVIHFYCRFNLLVSGHESGESTNWPILFLGVVGLFSFSVSFNFPIRSFQEPRDWLPHCFSSPFCHFPVSEFWILDRLLILTTLPLS